KRHADVREAPGYTGAVELHHRVEVLLGAVQVTEPDTQEERVAERVWAVFGGRRDRHEPLEVCGGPLVLPYGHPGGSVFVDRLSGVLGLGEVIRGIDQRGARGVGLVEIARRLVGPRGVVEQLLAARADVGLVVPARFLGVLVPDGDVLVPRLAVERPRARA